ncbi:MAG: BON domain-containing protein [Pyrinomonadaceae bacterium]|nr:BON domain-containing protein [Pyrinomonadaceae bacterium]
MKITLITATVSAAFLLGACNDAPKTDMVNTTKQTNSNVGTVTNTGTSTTATNTISNTTSSANNSNKNLTRDEYDKNNKTYEQQAKDAGAKVGTGLNDTWLWTKIRSTTATSTDLTDTTKVDVEVNNEVVTLKGSVPNASDKTKLVALVKGIDGVKSVTDNLKIVATDANATSNANSTANTNKATTNKK